MIPTEGDRRAAMEWLEQAARRAGLAHDCTLKAMLAEPRLPAANDHAAIDALERAFCERGCPISRVRITYMLETLHTHLAKPRTKTVDVWRVEWAFKDTSGNWHAAGRNEETEAEVRSYERTLVDAGATCIRVTGPHEQEVPA